jgi:hypothetical protein
MFGSIRRIFEKIVGVFLVCGIRLLLLPAFFGAPGYFLIGCVGFVLLNGIGVIGGLIADGKADYYTPRHDVSFFKSMVEDGKDIFKYLW